MGETLVNKIIPQLNRMKWPDAPQTTEAGIRTYQEGLDRVDMYRNDPKDLAAALKIFQSADSQPLAYGGIAYTLLAASKEADGTYAQNGVQQAMAWLEKAQESAPDSVDINFIESLVYVYSQQYDNARLVLDYLHGQVYDHYYLFLCEVAYWEQNGDLDAMSEWCEKASQTADTVPQRLRLIDRLADAYMKAGDADTALAKYKEALQFTKEDPSLYHKISVIYWQQENLEEASRYNKMTLKVDKKYTPAIKMYKAIKAKEEEEKSGAGGFLGRLFGS